MHCGREQIMIALKVDKMSKPRAPMLTKWSTRTLQNSVAYVTQIWSRSEKEAIRLQILHLVEKQLIYITQLGALGELRVCNFEPLTELQCSTDRLVKTIVGICTMARKVRSLWRAILKTLMGNGFYIAFPIVYQKQQNGLGLDKRRNTILWRPSHRLFYT